MKRKLRFILWALLMSGDTALARPQAKSGSPEPSVVRYRATMSDVKYLYGVAPPVARLRPGDVLETNTVDAFGNAIRKPGDTLSLVKGDNPLTGPFYIEGAEPGDTLVVKFLEVEVDSDQGVGAFAPGFGALNPLFTRRCSTRRYPRKSGFIPWTARDAWLPSGLWIQTSRSNSPSVRS